MLLHVSVTGIKLKQDCDIKLREDYENLLPSSQKLAEARLVQGLLATEVECSHGMHYTMCTWVSKESMNRYLCSFQYMQALKVSLELGSFVKEHTFETSTMPFWTSSVRKEWEEKGRTLFQQNSKEPITSVFPRCGSRSGQKMRKHKMKSAAAVRKKLAVAPIA